MANKARSNRLAAKRGDDMTRRRNAGFGPARASIVQSTRASSSAAKNAPFPSHGLVYRRLQSAPPSVPPQRQLARRRSIAPPVGVRRQAARPPRPASTALRKKPPRDRWRSPPATTESSRDNAPRTSTAPAAR